MPHEGDAADDPAIWVHPGNPTLSTVIGTDKKGGLAVYDLEGRQIQYLPDGEMNNVDIRSGFPLGGQQVTLVTTGNRTNNTIAIYQGERRHAPAGKCGGQRDRHADGLWLLHVPQPNQRQVLLFCELRAGPGPAVASVRQRRGQGRRGQGARVRGGQPDRGLRGRRPARPLLYRRGSTGIWKYGAEPSAGSARTQVDKTGSGGHLTADVEGLTIYQAGNGTGYLIASNQGDSSYVIYRREGANAYVATFEIVAGNGIDATSDTDGIDVTSANLGPAFPQGMFVAQDGNNDDCNQNFKFVPWHTIAASLGLADAAGPATSQRKPAGTTHTIRGSVQQPGANCLTPTAAAPAFVPLVIDENG